MDGRLAHDSVAALLGRVAEGDRAAFSELYRIAGPKLFALVIRICRDRGLAEDALQDVFVDVWRQAGRFDPSRGRAMSWLAAIARNRAIDALRRAGRPGAPGVADPAALIESLPDPSRLDEDEADLVSLLDCLARLGEQDRGMVLLAYYEGRSREELAERNAMPVNTVKTRLRRALIALRRCLGG